MPILIGWDGSALFVENQAFPPMALGDDPWLSASAVDGTRDDIIRLANSTTGTNEFEIALFATGVGGVSPGEVSVFDSDEAYWPLDAADLDGDGLDELVVTDASQGVEYSARLRILEWNGSGFVSTDQLIDYNEGCGYPMGVRAANIDGDAYEDIVIATDCAHPLIDPLVYLVRGLAKFPETEWQVDSVPIEGVYDELSIADLNADGVDDIILSLWRSELSVLIARGDGSFEEQVVLWSDGQPALALDGDPNWVWQVADLDGDGAKEILAGRTAILHAASDPTFAEYLPEGALAPIELFVSAGDISGDGVDDLLVRTSELTEVLISGPGQ